jgi:hypothetical protein
VLTKVASAVTQYLDPRFVRSVWLPCQVAWAVLIALILTGVGWSRVTTWWSARPGDVQVGLLAFMFATTTFFALVVSAGLPAVTRLAEGYWDHLPGGGSLAKWRRAHWQERRKALMESGDVGQASVYLGFPPAPEVMPTRLGNVIKSAEAYPMQRYGLDGVLTWPRLYSCLPDRFLGELVAVKSSIDLMLTVVTCAVLFAVPFMVAAWSSFGPSAGIFALVGSAAVAWSGYTAAISSASPYSELIRTAFDLYRRDLLTALGWSAPKSYAQERRQWEQIGKLWYYGLPDGPAGARQLGYPSDQSEAAPVTQTVGPGSLES